MFKVKLFFINKYLPLQIIGPVHFSLLPCISCFFLVLEEIEWIVLWEALIRSSRGSSQNIVIILLVFPAVRMSLRDYLRIYSGKVFINKN
jgi:hypothetical protein